MTVKALAAKRNDTVAHAQDVTAHFATARKQTGRRYGPPPKFAPRTRPTTPLIREDRLHNYWSQNGQQTVTQRQARQLNRMEARNEPESYVGSIRRLFGKGYATPKQQKPVRRVAR